MGLGDFEGGSHGWLIRAFHKLLIHWGRHSGTTTSRFLTKNRPKTKIYTVIFKVKGSDKRGQSGINVSRKTEQVCVFDVSKKKLQWLQKCRYFSWHDCHKSSTVLNNLEFWACNLTRHKDRLAEAVGPCWQPTAISPTKFVNFSAGVCWTDYCGLSNYQFCTNDRMWACVQIGTVCKSAVFPMRRHKALIGARQNQTVETASWKHPGLISNQLSPA